MSDPASQVVVAGSINMDVVARAPRHPLPGETLRGRGVELHPGGKGANQAVAAARLGAATQLRGSVGDDAFGADVVRAVEASGVDVRGVARLPGSPTGTALIVVDDAGENTIVSARGANDEVAAAAVVEPPVAAGAVAVAQLEIPLEATAAFLENAGAAGAITVLNAAPAQPCPEDVLTLARVIVVNEWELARLARCDPVTDPAEVVRVAGPWCDALGGPAVVVTLGPSGAVALAGPGDRQAIHVPGRPVRAVDATGAGDSFVGALAVRFGAGDALEAAVSYANVAASLAVQVAGALPSMPTGAGVDAALAAG